MTLHVSSTVVLIIRGSKLYYTASGIVTLCRWPSGAHSCADVMKFGNFNFLEPSGPLQAFNGTAYIIYTQYAQEILTFC